MSKSNIVSKPNPNPRIILSLSLQPLSLLRSFLTVLLALALVLPMAGPVFGAPVAQDQDSEQATLDIQVPEAEKTMLQILLQVKDLVLKAHPSDVTAKAMYEGMLRGLMDSLGDPYSEFLTVEEYAKFTSAMNSTYSGVGLVIQLVDGKVTVMSLVRGGPAEEAGVRPGDVILSVDGKEYDNVNDVSDALRGPEDTGVVLVVTRPSTGEVLHFGLSRRLLTPSAVHAEDLGDGIFYIDINQFDNGVGMTFGAEVARIKGLGAKGLILDLRDNPGGLLDAGLEVTQHLVPKGPILELQGKTERQIITGSQDTAPIPVVVLVNERSASASEIVAGAVRDYGVGVLVGARTYGKGSIQQIIPLGEEIGAIRLTIANYYTPSGTAISGNGLQPDIEVGPGPALPAKLEYNRVLTNGLVGLDVLALQETLAYLGYYTGKVDGIFGPRTDQAVRAFMAGQGRAYNGSLGRSEVEALNAAVAAKTLAAPDTAYLRALDVLRDRLATGRWHVSQ